FILQQVTRFLRRFYRQALFWTTRIEGAFQGATYPSLRLQLITIYGLLVVEHTICMRIIHPYRNGDLNHWYEIATDA
ncbi:MAG: hypothetical protein ACI9Z7_001850, partial [Alteromonas macleodii]